MLEVIQFVTTFVFLPAVYILIAMFDANLIRRAEGWERIRMLAGVTVGVLLSVIVIQIDLAARLFDETLLPDPSSVGEVGPWVVISLLVGFLLMVLVHLILRAKAARGFIVLFTIFGVIVSVYFLLSSDLIRRVMAVLTVGFLSGVIGYVIVRPEVIGVMVRGGLEEYSETPGDREEAQML